VDQGGRVVLPRNVAEKFGVLGAAVEVTHPGGEVIALLFSAVKDRRLVAVLHQLPDDVGTAKAGATDYEDSHLS
jgi:hypothetical protein